MKSRSRNKYKILFFVVLIIALFQGVWIYFSSDYSNTITLPPYSFNDSIGGLVIASGSWVSDTDLAYPVQTTQIECWQEFDHCWITDSAITDDKFFSLGSDIEQIARWTDDVIETVPSVTGFGCVEYFYRLDRRSETVTSTRRTIDNTSEICEGIQDEPIVSKLGNGWERTNQ